MPSQNIHFNFICEVGHLVGTVLYLALHITGITQLKMEEPEEFGNDLGERHFVAGRVCDDSHEVKSQEQILEFVGGVLLPIEFCGCEGLSVRTWTVAGNLGGGEVALDGSLLVLPVHPEDDSVGESYQLTLWVNIFFLLSMHLSR